MLAHVNLTDNRFIKIQDGSVAFRDENLAEVEKLQILLTLLFNKVSTNRTDFSIESKENIHSLTISNTQWELLAQLKEHKYAYLVKSLRNDEYYFTETKFIPMVTKDIRPYSLEEPDKIPQAFLAAKKAENIPLRFGKHKPYKIAVNPYASTREERNKIYIGLYQNRPKNPNPLKAIYSKPQSTTYVFSGCNIPLFGSHKERAKFGMAGVVFNLHDTKSVMPHRFYIYDNGTKDRPDEAWEIDALKSKESHYQNKLFGDLQTFEEQLVKPKNQHKYNEVLARLRFQCETSAVGLFEEDLQSKWLAIYYARLVTARMRALGSQDYVAPILFFKNHSKRTNSIYCEEDQARDIALANHYLVNDMEFKLALDEQKWNFLLVLTVENSKTALERQYMNRPLFLYLIEIGLIHIARHLFNTLNVEDRQQLHETGIAEAYFAVEYKKLQTSNSLLKINFDNKSLFELSAFKNDAQFLKHLLENNCIADEALFRIAWQSIRASADRVLMLLLEKSPHLGYMEASQYKRLLNLSRDESNAIQKLVGLFDGDGVITRRKYKNPSAYLAHALKMSIAFGMQEKLKHLTDSHHNILSETHNRNILYFAIRSMPFNLPTVLQLLDSGALWFIVDEYGETIFHALVSAFIQHSINRAELLTVLEFIHNNHRDNKKFKIIINQNMQFPRDDNSYTPFQLLLSGKITHEILTVMPIIFYYADTSYDQIKATQTYLHKKYSKPFPFLLSANNLLVKMQQICKIKAYALTQISTLENKNAFFERQSPLVVIYDAMLDKLKSRGFIENLLAESEEVMSQSIASLTNQIKSLPIKQQNDLMQLIGQLRKPELIVEGSENRCSIM